LHEFVNIPLSLPGIHSVPARTSIFAKSSTSLNVFDPSSLVISDALSDAQEIASRLDGGGAILLVPILGGALVATILAWSIYAVSVPTVDEDA